MQMVRSSGLCGFSVVVTEFGASRVAATSGNSSYRSFDLAEATEARTMKSQGSQSRFVSSRAGPRVCAP